MARYFDSFNRTNGAPGTSDSGDVYSAYGTSPEAAIVSSVLTNTDAAAAAYSVFDVGMREFDITITLGTILGKNLTFLFGGIGGFGVLITGSATVGSIALGEGTGNTLASATGLNVPDAGTVRIVATKRNIKVYNGATVTPVINFASALHPDDSAMAWKFPASATAGTIQSATCKALGGVLVSDVSDRVKRKRGIQTTNTTQFSDTWFMETLADVTRMILKEVPVDFMQNSVSVTAASAGRVNLAPSVQDVTAVWITGQRPMTPMSQDEYLDLISRGVTRQPFKYCVIHGGTAVYGPQMLTEPPDATYTVNYTYRPGFDSAYFATTDDVLFPSDWIDAIVDFMTGHTYDKDEDPANADRWYAKGVEKLTQIKSIEEDRYNRSIQKKQYAGRVIYVGAVEHLYQP